MATRIEVFYDFRSPYAYFASHRIRRGGFAGSAVNWTWQPVSIDILLNLQAGRESFSPYVDPLSGAKRAHLIADVRRLASYYDLPLRPTKPQRPNSIPALRLAAVLKEGERARFSDAVFDALWQQQADISEADVLARCLNASGASADALSRAFESSAAADVADQTVKAYARGVFGVPTFAWNDELFFGNDRLDLLLWAVGKRELRQGLRQDLGRDGSGTAAGSTDPPKSKPFP
jgi:2-hydroxychromene-2-carboxylate isomerase